MKHVEGLHNLWVKCKVPKPHLASVADYGTFRHLLRGDSCRTYNEDDRK